MSVAYVCLLNKLIPTDLTYKDVKRLLNKDPLELFEFIKDLVEDQFGYVRRVKIHDCNVWRGSIIVEYFAYTEYSRIPVRIICASDSAELFIEV